MNRTNKQSPFRFQTNLFHPEMSDLFSVFFVLFFFFRLIFLNCVSCWRRPTKLMVLDGEREKSFSDCTFNRWWRMTRRGIQSSDIFNWCDEVLGGWKCRWRKCTCRRLNLIHVALALYKSRGRVVAVDIVETEPNQTRYISVAWARWIDVTPPTVGSLRE